MMNDLKLKQKAMTNAQLSPDVNIKPFYTLLVSYGVKPRFLKSFEPTGNSLPPEYINSIQGEIDSLQAGIDRLDINISLLAMIVKELIYQYDIYDNAAKEYKTLNKELKKINEVKALVELYNTNTSNISGLSIYHRIGQSELGKNDIINESTFREGKLTIREEGLTNCILELLSNNISELEKKYQKLNHTKIALKYSNTKSKYRQYCVLVIYKFLTKSGVKIDNENQLYVLGGKILYLAGFMPQPKRKLTNSKDWDEFYRSNFFKSFKNITQKSLT